MSAIALLWASLVLLPQGDGAGETAPAPPAAEAGPAGAQEPPAAEAPAREDRAQEPPAVQEPRPPESWWRELPPEERRRFVERWRRFRELPPATREEIERRRALLEAERERLLAEMSEEERARLEALSPRERRAEVDRMLRERLEARARELGREIPGWRDRFRDRPLPDRFRDSSRLLDERRRPRLLEALDREVEEGWLGPRAREWAQDAPLPELAELLGQVRKWRALERLREEGEGRRLRLDPLQWQHLVELPPRAFFRTLEALRRGVPPERALRPGPELGPGGGGAWGQGLGPGPGVGPQTRPGVRLGARPGQPPRWRPGESRPGPWGPGLRRPPRRPSGSAGPPEGQRPPPAPETKGDGGQGNPSEQPDASSRGSGDGGRVF